MSQLVSLLHYLILQEEADYDPLIEPRLASIAKATLTEKYLMQKELQFKNLFLMQISSSFIVLQAMIRHISTMPFLMKYMGMVVVSFVLHLLKLRLIFKINKWYIIPFKS